MRRALSIASLVLMSLACVLAGPVFALIIAQPVGVKELCDWVEASNVRYALCCLAPIVVAVLVLFACMRSSQSACERRARE